MLICNAMVYTMAGEDYQNGYIHILDGKIAAVGEMQNAPSDSEKVDAGGRIAVPGFVDAHCHIGMWEDGLGFEGDDGNEDTDPSTPQLRAIDAVNPFDRSFQEALEAGVTTVITGPGSSNPIAGQLCAMKTFGNRVDKMLIKAPLAIKMALGENPKVSYHAKSQAPVTRMAVAAIIREQLMKAKKYEQQVKEAALDEDLEEPEYDAKCEALLPLLRKEIPVHFHAHRADDIFTAIRIAAEFEIPYVLIHATEGHLVADELTAEGSCAVTGPLMGTRTKPELANFNIAGPGILKRAGVPTAICTDHPEVPCHYLLMSAQLAADAGMDRMDALRAITIDAAKIANVDSVVGSIEPGKDADILLFSTHPMQTRVSPDFVMINGICVKNQL